MVDIKELVERGGIYYNIVGASPSEALQDMVRTVKIPDNLDKNALYKAILQREELMPTAVGGGIAIPHPRNPLLISEDQQMVSICFLQDPIDFNALDRRPVHCLFLLLSASPKLHLQILSQLSYLCQREDFLALLEQKPNKAQVLEYIASIESAWR